VNEHNSDSSSDDDISHSPPNNETDEEKADVFEDEDSRFVVDAFDKDDEMNPRRIPRWRKWMIILILSASALCV